MGLFFVKKIKIIPGATVGGNFQLFLFWRIDNKLPPLKTQDKKREVFIKLAQITVREEKQ